MWLKSERILDNVMHKQALLCRKFSKVYEIIMRQIMKERGTKNVHCVCVRFIRSVLNGISDFITSVKENREISGITHLFHLCCTI